MPFTAAWMCLESSILSEVSQNEKDKYMILFIYRIFKKILQTHLFIKQKQT